jgi:hypothetical protein
MWYIMSCNEQAIVAALELLKETLLETVRHSPTASLKVQLNIGPAGGNGERDIEHDITIRKRKYKFTPTAN